MIKGTNNLVLAERSYAPSIVILAQYDGPLVPVEPNYKEGVDVSISMAY